MVTYVEGSDKGKLRFMDVERGGECLFFLPTDFTDKVSCIHYNKEKNVFFAGSRDGKFRVWKVPKEWRSKEIDEMEREYEFSRK
jgi:WD40 repeat protein